MSYINKKGKTSAARQMITRQQISDVLSYGQIQTTHHKAKTTQMYLEKVITLGKRNTLESRRKAAGILLGTQKFTKDQLLKELFDKIAPNYQSRNGGYTRVLKLGKKEGDNTEKALLKLV